MVTEEFSFPIIHTTNNNNNNNHHVVHNQNYHHEVLPPLWRISSLNRGNSNVNVNDADDDQLEQQNGVNKKIFRASFSEIESRIMRTLDGDEHTKGDEREKSEEEEEKMDMLWEDFNDEVNVCCSSSTTVHSGSDYEYEQNDKRNNRYGVDEIESGEELHDMIITTKKKRLKAAVHMLKKLSLLQHMARIKKRGPH